MDAIAPGVGVPQGDAVYHVSNRRVR